MISNPNIFLNYISTHFNYYKHYIKYTYFNEQTPSTQDLSQEHLDSIYKYIPNIDSLIEKFGSKLIIGGSFALREFIRGKYNINDIDIITLSNIKSPNKIRQFNDVDNLDEYTNVLDEQYKSLNYFNKFTRKINLAKNFNIQNNTNNITSENMEDEDIIYNDVFLDNKDSNTDVEDFDREILGSITYTFYNKNLYNKEIKKINPNYHNLNYDINKVKKFNKVDDVKAFNKHQYICINSFDIKTPQQLIEWYSSVSDLPVFIYYDNNHKKLRWYIKDNYLASKATEYILFNKEIKHTSRQENYHKKGFSIL